jgi:hypothetical protein
MADKIQYSKLRHLMTGYPSLTPQEQKMLLEGTAVIVRGGRIGSDPYRTVRYGLVTSPAEGEVLRTLYVGCPYSLSAYLVRA